MLKFYVSDKPKGLSITEWVSNDKAFKKARSKVKPKHKYLDPFTVQGLDYNPTRLLSDIVGESQTRENNLCHTRATYTSGRVISAHKDSPKAGLTPSQYRSYFNDGYSHRIMAPMWRNTEVEHVMSQFLRTTLNCRISTLHAEGRNFLWNTGIHCDQNLMVESRLILNLGTAPEFFLQYLKHGIPRKLTFDHFGQLYTFDSSRVHRAYFSKPTGRIRTAVLLGFSPWLDYDAVEDCWAANEFYGELHPLDIINEGYVFKKGSNV